MRRLVMEIWLVVLWLLLWRDVSVANVVSGLLIAFVATSGSTNVRSSPARHRVRPLALVRLAVYFFWKLLVANVELAREIVTAQNVIHTGIIAVPMTGYSDFQVTVVGNAVSLTPGTLTLEVRREPEPVLYLHVLHLHDIEHARNDVLAMTRRAAAAFPFDPVTTQGASTP